MGRLTGLIERSLDRERDRVILLVILYFVVAGFVLSHPHSFASPTVPDEKAYIGWAMVYLNGSLDMPVQDWFGIKADKDVFVDANGPHAIGISAVFADINGTGKKDDVTVSVKRYDSGGLSPAVGATVTLQYGNGKSSQRTTDTNGQASFTNLPDGFAVIEASFRFSGFTLKQGIVLSSPNGLAYQGLIEVAGYVRAGAQFKVTFQGKDLLSTPINGANVTLMAVPSGPTQSGRSSSNGQFNVTISPGTYHVTYRKPQARGESPFATVVIVDGKPLVVNHWPPGYSFVLAGTIALRIVDATALIMMAIGSISIYVLVRRLFDPTSAFFASCVYMTAGIAIAIVWTSGMADYASLTFACAGLALFAESVFAHHVKKRTKWAVLGLASGLLLAASVWTRYSTATMLVAPLALLVCLFVLDLKEAPGGASSEASMARVRHTVNALKVRCLQSIPFLLGLLLLLAPLFWYNMHYFNGPFNSGYSYGSQISVSTSDSGTNASVNENNYFSNFDPVDSLSTVDERLRLLPLVMAPVIAVPIMLAVRRRDMLVWWGFVAFGANFFLYLFVPWVASWGDLTRSIEDMRYFLPALVGGAMLCGVGLSILYGGKKSAALAILLIIMLAGFASAGVAIDLQNARLRPQVPGGQPPSQQDPHKLVTIAMLVWNPSKYNATLIEIRNATFVQWVNAATFLISDVSTSVRCAVRLDGYTSPALNASDRLTIKGLFTWVDINGNGISDEKELTVGVKGGTSDGIWKT